MDICERVISHAPGKINSVEYFYLVSGLLKQKANLLKAGALWIGKNVAAVKLHGIGLTIKARLTCTGTTDNKDILVPVM